MEGRRINIAFCHHLSLAYYGGGEKWIISLSKELKKRGHDIKIYALPFLLDGKPKIDIRKILDGISYQESLFHKVKADITYVTYNPLSWLNFQFSRPCIAGLHTHCYWKQPHLSYGFLPNLANVVNRFTSYFELRRFNAIHTITNIYPVNHPRVYYIPDFVDTDFFKPSKKDKDFSAIYASRMVWQKGYDILEIVRDKLKLEIEINISGGKIPEKDLPRFLGRGHVTLVPSRVDTFGMIITESMACRTPVITTPLETHKALDLPLIYAKTPSDFVKRILELKSTWNKQNSEYMDFSEECRKMVLEKYDKEIIVDKIEKMFEEVVYC